jgi:hypothetical protein
MLRFRCTSRYQTCFFNICRACHVRLEFEQPLTHAYSLLHSSMPMNSCDWLQYSSSVENVYASTLNRPFSWSNICLRCATGWVFCLRPVGRWTPWTRF